MPLYNPETDRHALRAALARPDGWLVACFCAAWCGTCTEYRPLLAKLSDAWPQHTFVWLDIEDQPEFLGDEDVENFPTLLVSAPGRTLFYGTILPHIHHLQRLLESLGADSPAVETQLPDVRALLSA